MDETLLSYFNRELNYLRKGGAEFADKHPKIAGRLRLDKDIVEDPHVSRLVESFAFLTARIRHSLDDSFPELSESLMGVLYPDYHAPIPSMSVTEFTLLPSVQQKMTIPRGETLRISDGASNICFFKTSTETTVLPIQIENIQYSSLPVKSPKLTPKQLNGKTVKSLLTVRINPLEQGSQFDFEENHLKFYINTQTTLAFKLYELLFNNIVSIAIAENPYDEAPFFLTPECLLASGFSEEERLLNVDNRSSVSHQLLVEYFLLPQKFLFFTLEQLSHIWEKYPNGFTIYFYFDDHDEELIHLIDKRSLLLGCAPVVNLFDSTSDPIQAAEVGHESLLRPSQQNDSIADIYHIKEISAVNAQGERQVVPPFYANHLKQEDHAFYWSLRRENSSWHSGQVSHGTDTYVSFVDADHQVIDAESEWIINAEIICTNRDQPNKLPFGPDLPIVNFSEGGAGLRANCLLPPTATVSPSLNAATRWQLTSQLSLQHYSDDDGLSKLKETLALYNLNHSKEVSSLIEGIVDIQSELMTTRVLEQGRSAMCQGTHFVLTCDESFYSGHGLYLFGLLMNEFFAQNCTVNTFIKLSIKTVLYSRIVFSWPPRTGCQHLV